MWSEHTDRRVARYLQLYDTREFVEIAAALNSPDDFSSLLSLPRIIVNALQKQNLSANWLLEPPRKFGKTVFTKYRSAFN